MYPTLNTPLGAWGGILISILHYKNLSYPTLNTPLGAWGGLHLERLFYYININLSDPTLNISVS